MSLLSGQQHPSFITCLPCFLLWAFVSCVLWWLRSHRRCFNSGARAGQAVALEVLLSSQPPQKWIKLEAFAGPSGSWPGLSPSLCSALTKGILFFLEAFSAAIVSVKMKWFRDGLQHRNK